jgi:hypothetical protein
VQSKNIRRPAINHIVIKPNQNAMPLIPVFRFGKTAMLVFIAAVTVTGCSKKAEISTAPAPDAGAATAAATPAPAPAPAAHATAVPVLTDIKQSLAEVDAALKAKAYEKAVQNLLAVQQQKQLTEEQAQQAHSEMVGLQQNLAAAIAAGDPNAKAAAELLRRSAMVP